MGKLAKIDVKKSNTDTIIPIPDLPTYGDPNIEYGDPNIYYGLPVTQDEKPEIDIIKK